MSIHLRIVTVTRHREKGDIALDLYRTSTPLTLDTVYDLQGKSEAELNRSKDPQEGRRQQSPQLRALHKYREALLNTQDVAPIGKDPA